MQPIKFPQANFNWAKPNGTTDEQVGGLPAWKGKEQDSDWPVSISVWEVTPEDLERIKNSGKIYLRVYGEGHPVVSIDSKDPWRKSPMELILDERRDQLTRHGYTLEHDKLSYKDQELIRVAQCIRNRTTEFGWPKYWNQGWYIRFANKPRIEALAVAGALVLAQQDVDDLPEVSKESADILKLIIEEMETL